MKHLITAAFICCAPPASAEVLCQFTQECFEDEGCQSSDFAFTLEPMTDAQGTEHIVMQTVYAALPVTFAALDETGALRALIEDDSSLYMLRSEAQSDTSGARLTLHMQGPHSITYLGACEGAL